jgi:hypothetical protein
VGVLIGNKGGACNARNLVSEDSNAKWYLHPIHFFLQGPPIVEHVSYPKLTGHEAEAEPAAIAFARHAKTRTVPPDAIPSLVDGLAELRRVI